MQLIEMVMGKCRCQLTIVLSKLSLVGLVGTVAIIIVTRGYSIFASEYKVIQLLEIKFKHKSYPASLLCNIM